MEKEELPFEQILGKRNGYNGSEYLVKYKGKSFREVKWLSDKKIRKFKDGQSFITKSCRGGVKTEEPFYDPLFEEMEKIVSKKDNEYLVKWRKLNYEQCTYERNVDEIEKERFESLVPESMPTHEEDINRPFVFPETSLCELDKNELVTYRYVSTLIKEHKNLNLLDQLNFSSMNVITAVITDLLSIPEERGPYLIISSSEEADKWSEVLREASVNIHPLLFIGPKENREKISEIDLILEQNICKYNVFITTPEVFEAELDEIKSINWRLLILNDDQSKRSLKWKHIKDTEKLNIGVKIRIDQQSISSTLNGIQQIVSDINDEEFEQHFNEEEIEKANEIINAIDPLIQGRKRIAVTNKSTIINCPLTDVQCHACQRIFIDGKNDILLNYDYSIVAQRLLRCLTHPYLSFDDIDVDLIKSSTKFMVMKHIIDETIENQKSIVIISQYETALDIIEDILIENEYPWRRFTSIDADSEKGAEVFVQGQSTVFLYCYKLSNAIDVPLHIIDTAVLLDAPQTIWARIQQHHREGRMPISNVTKTYLLESTDLKEESLNKLCNDLGTPNNALLEQICKMVAIRTLTPCNIPSIPDLIARSAPRDIIKEASNPYLDFEDFWNIYFDTLDTPYIPLIAEKPKEDGEGQTAWNAAERDDFIRWLARFGVGRSDEIRIKAHLKHSTEEVTFATKAFIRLLLRLTTVQYNFSVAKSFISKDTEEEIEEQIKFIESEPFNEDMFRERVKNDAMGYLKRFEMLFYLCSLFDKSSTPWHLIPALKLAGSPPAQQWSDDLDRALLYANYIFGFGVYDKVLEGDDPRLYGILGTTTSVIEQIKLDDRTVRLCESAKRLQLSDEKIIETISMSIKQVGLKIDESAAIVQYILNKGIEENENGEKDYEKIMEGADIEGKDVSEIQTYVESVLASCENTGNCNSITMNTAQKLLQRISTMKQLRNIINSLDEKTGPAFFERAPKWRGLPSKWSKHCEYQFFQDLSERGFNCLQNIFMEEIYQSVFEQNTPQFLLNDHSIMKRIEALYQFKETKDKLPVKETHKSSSSKSKHKVSKREPVMRSITLSALPKVITFPLAITQSSAILSLGKVVYDREGFHTARYIYPAGYRSVKTYASVHRPEERVNWVSEIRDTGKKGPLFVVYMEDEPNVCFSAETPSAPWVSVLKAVAVKRKEKNKTNAISGPEAFLLSNPIVQYLIQNLENADKCFNYKQREFKGAPEEPPKIIFNDSDEAVPHPTPSPHKSTPKANRKQYTDSDDEESISFDDDE